MTWFSDFNVSKCCPKEFSKTLYIKSIHHDMNRCILYSKTCFLSPGRIYTCIVCVYNILLLKLHTPYCDLWYAVTKIPYSILCAYDMLLLKLHTVCSWYAVTKTPYSILYVYDLLLLLQILVNTAQQRQALNEVEQRHREIIALEHDIQV